MHMDNGLICIAFYRDNLFKLTLRAGLGGAELGSAWELDIHFVPSQPYLGWLAGNTTSVLIHYHMEI